MVETAEKSTRITCSEATQDRPDTSTCPTPPARPERGCPRDQPASLPALVGWRLPCVQTRHRVRPIFGTALQRLQLCAEKKRSLSSSPMHRRVKRQNRKQNLPSLLCTLVQVCGNAESPPERVRNSSPRHSLYGIEPRDRRRNQSQYSELGICRATSPVRYLYMPISGPSPQR